MNLEFDYLKRETQSFPVIDIELSHPAKSIKLKVLVDSGATFSVFRSEVAEYLDIDIEKGKAIYLTGIGGRILGYIHNIKIKVSDKNFICKIIFSKEFNVSFNILGRNNFFIPFLITFNERRKKVILNNE